MKSTRMKVVLGQEEEGRKKGRKRTGPWLEYTWIILFLCSYRVEVYFLYIATELIYGSVVQW